MTTPGPRGELSIVLRPADWGASTELEAEQLREVLWRRLRAAFPAAGLQIWTLPLPGLESHPRTHAPPGGAPAEHESLLIEGLDVGIAVDAIASARVIFRDSVGPQHFDDEDLTVEGRLPPSR